MRPTSLDLLTGLFRRDIDSVTFGPRLYIRLPYAAVIYEGCDISQLSILPDQYTSHQSYAPKQFGIQPMLLDGRFYFLDTSPKHWTINSIWLVNFWDGGPLSARILLCPILLDIGIRQSADYKMTYMRTSLIRLLKTLNFRKTRVYKYRVVTYFLHMLP